VKRRKRREATKRSNEPRTRVTRGGKRRWGWRRKGKCEKKTNEIKRKETPSRRKKKKRKRSRGTGRAEKTRGRRPLVQANGGTRKELGGGGARKMKIGARKMCILRGGREKNPNSIRPKQSLAREKVAQERTLVRGARPRLT